MKLYYIFILMLLFLIPESYALTNVSACGTLSTANEYYQLNQSINSSGTCITINANNITLDGVGYTINYSQSATGYGINNSGGFDNILIKNISFIQGSSSANYIIYSNGMSNSIISDNTLTNQYDIGIYFDYGFSSFNNSVVRNLINSSITSSYKGGIRFVSVSVDITHTYNNISNNTIITNQNINHGISCSAYCHYNIISNNIINSSGTNARNIYLDVSTHNSVKLNSISSTGQGANTIQIGSLSDDNLIVNNTLYITGLSASGLVLADADLNNITSNNITVAGTSESGIYVEAGASNNNFLNNAIFLTGAASEAVGLYTNSAFNTFINNSFFLGNSAYYGVRISSSSSNSFSGGTIERQSYGYTNVGDYYLSSAGGTNNFSNTNFTALRKIQFDDSTSQFNYNADLNNNTIWLKTNISGAGYLNRTLNSWSFGKLSWNETPSTGLTINYTVNGFLSNREYNFKENGITIQKITTDIFGSLTRGISLLSESSLSFEDVPLVHNDSLSNSSGTTGVSFDIFVNITEANNITWAYVEVTSPDALSQNKTMILQSQSGTEYLFNYTFTPTSDGVYSFTFYALDENNNLGAMNGTQNYTATAIPVPPSGGGSSATTQNYSAISIYPLHLELSAFSLGNKTVSIQVKNAQINDVSLKPIATTGKEFVGKIGTGDFYIIKSGEEIKIDIPMMFDKSGTYLIEFSLSDAAGQPAGQFDVTARVYGQQSYFEKLLKNLQYPLILDPSAEKYTVTESGIRIPSRESTAIPIGIFIGILLLSVFNSLFSSALFLKAAHFRKTKYITEIVFGASLLMTLAIFVMV